MHSVSKTKWSGTVKRAGLLLLFLCISLLSIAQNSDSLLARQRDSITAAYRDTNYVLPYTRYLTTRVFLSQKYTLFALENSRGYRDIQYRPNTNLSVGAGFTYRAITMNFAYGFKFMNPDDEKGKTEYLDLQAHLYGIKWRFDWFGQFYKGYYIFPKGYGTSDGSSYYHRGDLRVRDFGLSASHIFNSKRFSYRAAFLQSEWQKKSAGSFLAGASFVVGSIRGDSAFVPQVFEGNYLQRDVKELNYLGIGPGAGYAYTFVFKEHWFITGSASLNLVWSLIKETNLNGISSSSGYLAPNVLIRAGLGYNSSSWGANVSWVASRTAVEGQFSTDGYHINSGNYRLSVNKRFITKGKTRNFLNKVDGIFNRFIMKTGGNKNKK